MITRDSSVAIIQSQSLQKAHFQQIFDVLYQAESSNQPLLQALHSQSAATAEQIRDVINQQQPVQSPRLFFVEQDALALHQFAIQRFNFLKLKELVDGLDSDDANLRALQAVVDADGGAIPDSIRQAFVIHPAQFPGVDVSSSAAALPNDPYSDAQGQQQLGYATQLQNLAKAKFAELLAQSIETQVINNTTTALGVLNGLAEGTTFPQVAGIQVTAQYLDGRLDPLKSSAQTRVDALIQAEVEQISGQQTTSKLEDVLPIANETNKAEIKTKVNVIFPFVPPLTSGADLTDAQADQLQAAAKARLGVLLKDKIIEKIKTADSDADLNAIVKIAEHTTQPFPSLLLVPLVDAAQYATFTDPDIDKFKAAAKRRHNFVKIREAIAQCTEVDHLPDLQSNANVGDIRKALNQHTHIANSLSIQGPNDLLNDDTIELRDLIFAKRRELQPAFAVYDTVLLIAEQSSDALHALLKTKKDDVVNALKKALEDAELPIDAEGRATALMAPILDSTLTHQTLKKILKDKLGLVVDDPTQCATILQELKESLGIYWANEYEETLKKPKGLFAEKQGKKERQSLEAEAQRVASHLPRYETLLKYLSEQRLEPNHSNSIFQMPNHDEAMKAIDDIEKTVADRKQSLLKLKSFLEQSKPQSLIQQAQSRKVDALLVLVKDIEQKVATFHQQQSQQMPGQVTVYTTDVTMEKPFTGPRAAAESKLKEYLEADILAQPLQIASNATDPDLLKTERLKDDTVQFIPVTVQIKEAKKSKPAQELRTGALVTHKGSYTQTNVHFKSEAEKAQLSRLGSWGFMSQVPNKATMEVAAAYIKNQLNNMTEAEKKRGTLFLKGIAGQPPELVKGLMIYAKFQGYETKVLGSSLTVSQLTVDEFSEKWASIHPDDHGLAQRQADIRSTKPR